MLIFGLRSTSDDRPGWSMDSNPFCSQKYKMLIFGLRSISDDRPVWLMDSNPICHHSPPNKIKCSFLDYVQLLMIGRAGRWIQTPSTTPLQDGLVNGLKPLLPPLCSQKYKMLIFGLHSTSDDRPVWSMDSNPVCHPSPAKKMKCSFLDYVQLLKIGRAGRCTQTPFAKK